ncbi:MAG: Uncharacterised protein [Acidimicrobiales bacterium AG-410-I20]|nr:hypothetical protein [Actinomycetota bacterium]CAI8397643.1 MAG: Uncharacterised protein [Acidimicrobiales bacterium AG-410-I20]
MAIALNIAALILVIGITWAGMMWLANFIHVNRNKTNDPQKEEEE